MTLNLPCNLSIRRIRTLNIVYRQDIEIALEKIKSLINIKRFLDKQDTVRILIERIAFINLLKNLHTLIHLYDMYSV